MELNFISQRNLINGRSEWKQLPEDYDFHQEIARSAYADMLHDHDRNQRYYTALKRIVKKKHEMGAQAIVLDIGTGTGLLSMMAASAGADQIYACEAFAPMAECAKKVIARNGFADKITIIPKRSTDLKVGVDLPCRANLLVTEVFDTELIGEGAIRTYNHAVSELLTTDCDCVPKSATMYAMVVKCPTIKNFNILHDFPLTENIRIKLPCKQKECVGVPSVQDLQLSPIKVEEFSVVTPAVSIFKFDWEKLTPLFRQSNKHMNSKISCAKDEGLIVFSWWDLDMDGVKSDQADLNIITCQPEWFPNSVWRDHWMQAAYYVPLEDSIKEGDDYILQSFHDEYSFWFKIQANSQNVPNKNSYTERDRPFCDCGVHTVLSRSRIALLNDSHRRDLFLSLCRHIQTLPKKPTSCLIISDSPLLQLCLGALDICDHVFVLESESSGAQLTEKILLENNLQEKVTVCSKPFYELDSKDFNNMKPEIVVGEPYFHFAVHPWDYLHFWFSVMSLKKNLLSSQCKIFPGKAVLKAMAVNFDHLWKIKLPVHSTCGFNLVDFDTLIQDSILVSDVNVDTQPLWEYPGTCASKPITVLTLDLNSDLEDTSVTCDGSICLPPNQTANGIAFWMDWEFTNTLVLNSGPVSPCEEGKYIEWDKASKQAVHFFDTPLTGPFKIPYEIEFTTSGEMLFTFKK